jgi:hypothetical protein
VFEETRAAETVETRKDLDGLFEGVETNRTLQSGLEVIKFIQGSLLFSFFVIVVFVGAIGSFRVTVSRTPSTIFRA